MVSSLGRFACAFCFLTGCRWPTKESDVNWKVERTGKFRQLLLDLTEDNVCVVGHGAFTHALLRLKYVPKNCQVIFTRFVQGTFEVLD